MVRQVGAIAVAPALFIIAAWLLIGGTGGVIVGLLMEGFALGLGIAFATEDRRGRATALTRAMVGWIGCAAVFMMDVILSFAASPPQWKGHTLAAPAVVALDLTICVFALMALVTLGVSVVPLGGVLGGWLRGR